MGDVEATSSSSSSLRQRLSRLLSDVSTHRILGSDENSGALVQMWMPCKAQDGKTVLQASSLPFSVLGVGDLLALFRCVSVRYRFGTDSDQPHLMGAVGRVYSTMQPESSNNLQRSDKRLYLRVTEAQRCRVNATLVVPIFDPTLSRKPVAVFELSQSEKNCPFNEIVAMLDRCLEPLHLHSHTALSSPGPGSSPYLPLPGSWIEPKVLDGSPEHSSESADRECTLNQSFNLSSNGFLVRDLMPPPPSGESSRDPLTRGPGVNVQPTFDLKRISMNGMRHQITVPAQPSSSRSMAGVQQQQQQQQARPPMTHQQGQRVQGGLSASLAAHDMSTLKTHMPPPPPVPMSRANGSEAETSQQAKHLVEWMAANNVSTDTLKTILLSKSPAGDHQMKKKRVHESQEEISYQSLMQAQVAFDAGSGSGSRSMALPQSGPQTVPEPNYQPVDPLNQGLGGSFGALGGIHVGSRKSDGLGFDLEELGSDDEEDEEDPKAGGGHKSNYQGAKLTYEDLQGQFGKGIKDAAKALGICTTTLKRACRRHGITRWPRRQIAKLNKALAQIGYQGDASADLFESAVKGKAGGVGKPIGRPKSSTAVPMDDFFRLSSSFAQQAPPHSLQPDMMESFLLQAKTHPGQCAPLALMNPALNQPLAFAHQAFSSNAFSAQQQWGQPAQPSYPNHPCQPQQSRQAPWTAEMQPQASADMLNLALELFSGDQDVPDDVSFGSLLNEIDMKGMGF